MLGSSNALAFGGRGRRRGRVDIPAMRAEFLSNVCWDVIAAFVVSDNI